MEVLERNFNLEKDRQKEVFRKKVRVKEVFVILEKIMFKNNIFNNYMVLYNEKRLD